MTATVVVAGGSRPAEVVKPNPVYGDWTIPSVRSPMAILVDRFNCKTLPELEAALDEIEALLTANILSNMHFKGEFTATPTL